MNKVLKLFDGTDTKQHDFGWNKVLKLFDGTDTEQHDFGWYEFTLEELGLPSAEEILKGVNEISSQVMLQGWRSNGQTSSTYKGFGLTYNPTFFDKDENIYHQVWGSKLLSQSYSCTKGMGSFTNLENNYYDTFGFRRIPNDVNKHLGFFLDRFNFHISRSRVAYMFGYGQEPNNNKGWHVDEPSSHLLRINIPLQTSDDYVMQWNNNTYYLEIGKAYLWNTRKEHRPAIFKKVEMKQPRINVVLGLTPWLNYDAITDSYSKNEYFGTPIKDIVENKLFVKPM
jgi:hypothetical protein